MKNVYALVAAVVLAAGVAAAQAPAKSTFIGTVTSAKVAEGEIDVKTDGGAEIAVKLKPETKLERVEPGEKNLQNAKPIQAAEIAGGDRVLVSVLPGSTEARRVIVMAASDIAKRNEADRLDWTRRGVGGVVVSVSGNQIKLRLRTFAGEREALVNVTGKTVFRRYAPDSVKFADAKPSQLSEISAGDQLRARGIKSEDGLKVDAEEVVFGTFLTKAGTIKSVNAETKEITIQDLATNKPLVVKLSPDTQLKKMPGFPAPGGGTPMGMGMRPGGSPPNAAAGRAPGAGGPGMMGGRPGGGGDIAQMLERMPAATLADLKPGEEIVVSSTKGAQSDQITAIMLVANAGRLIQMATARPGAGQNRGEAAGGPAMGMGGGLNGLSGMMGGLEMPGMTP
jgi:hypothetical protein